MKKFIQRLALFCLPILLLAYPLDLFISNGLRNSTYSDGEIEIWNDLYNGDLQANHFFYGSSRAWVHFSPAIMEKETNIPFYNLGMDAHNFYMQHLRHEELLKHNSKPELIVLGLDMGSLEKRPDLYNKNMLLPFMLWNKTIADAALTYQGFTEADFIIPLYRYFGEFEAVKSGLKYYIKPDDRFRYRGYKGRDEKWNSDFDRAKAEIGSYTIKIDSLSVKLFEEFIVECKTDSIDLVFVYTPEYIEGQAFVKNRDSIMTMYNDFSEKYNVPFLDYSNDSICYHKDYFYNTMHMNRRGSELFTKKLAKDLIQYELLK